MEKKSTGGSKRQHIRAARVKKQRQQRINTLLVIGGVALLVAAILIYPSLQQTLAPVGEFVRVTPQARPQADFNAMGDPNAPVRMEAYSDFQCPFCKRFSDETEKLIVEKYVATGKVYFILYPYGPGGNYIGEESHDSALASFCAAEQGMFWEYKEYLFSNWSGENVGSFTPKRLAAFADALGLNMEQYKSCFSSKKYEERLIEGIQQGLKNNIGPTPSFLINGKLLQGAKPFADFEQAIEAALAASGN